MISVSTPRPSTAESVRDVISDERVSWWTPAGPGLAYALILVLQLKVMWKIWKYKDLTPDHTSYYYWFSHTLLVLDNGRPLEQYSKRYLDANNVGWIFLDETRAQNMKGLLDYAKSTGWRRAALDNAPGKRLVLYATSQAEFPR